MSGMSPGRILLFLLVVATLLVTLSLVFPSGGISLGKKLELRFVTKDDLLAAEQTTTVDISDAQRLSDSLEKVEEFPDVKKGEVVHIPAPGSVKRSIEWGGYGKDKIHTFFSTLDSLSLTGGGTRIMHYGDSQIESDRMTSYLRDKFQRYFGGKGPGLVPVTGYSGAAGVKITLDGSWEQYSLYGNMNGKGMTIGPLLSLSALCKLPPDSVHIDSVYLASAALQAGSALYTNARSFNRIRIFYNNRFPEASITIETGGETFSRPLNPEHTMLTINLSQWADMLSFTLKGDASTVIQGVSMESQTGVIVDNIPLRGSAGTIFKQADRRLMSDALNAMDVSLFILQFGGNVMPYIEDEQACINYGNWFYSQISYLQSIRPDAAFVIIGPSDMSIKEGSDYVTYPLLPKVRDALRSAAFRAGAGYFDMYEAMGGMNAMSAWVNADPPLAMPDYTHFSPRGARLMGEMFYEALMLEYHNYKK